MNFLIYLDLTQKEKNLITFKVIKVKKAEMETEEIEEVEDNLLFHIISNVLIP